MKNKQFDSRTGHQNKAPKFSTLLGFGAFLFACSYAFRTQY